MLSKEQLFGIIRHSFTIVGGILVMKGVVEESLLAELEGAVVALAGVIWSIYSKK